MKSFRERAEPTSLAALRPPGGAPAPVMPRLRLNAACGASTSSPQVDVVKEGDKVCRLVVTCACGERIEVECLYTPGV